MIMAIAIGGLIVSAGIMAFCKFSSWCERAERNMMRMALNGLPGKMYCRECCELVEVVAKHGPYVTTLDCSQCGEGIDLIIHPQ